MTTRLTRMALAAVLAMIAGGGMAHAQGRRGGMVGHRGGGGGGGFRGAPSFSGPAARPGMGGGGMNRPAPGGGINRPNPGGNPGLRSSPGGNGGQRPGPGGNPGQRPGPGGNGGQRPNPGGNPGQRPNPGGIGDRPPFGGIGGSRPPTGPGTGRPPQPGGGNRPGGGNGPGGIGGNRPGQGEIGGNRPRPGDNRPGPGGNRPDGGLVGHRPANGQNRPNLGDNLGIVNRPSNVNRPNIGNKANRPTNIGNNSGNTVINRPNSGNTVVNRPTNITNNINNITNVNRPGYGRGGWGGGGYGYGGRYGYGGYRPNPYAAYHAGWVNGYWNGHRSAGWGWGWNNWGLNALGLGVGIGVASWGIGSLWNSWGYSSFMNPYYMPTTVVQPSTVVVQPVVYDYSRPLDLTSPPPSQPIIDQAVASLDSARAAFQAGDYSQALKLADQAIQQTPNDPMLHQFRAICLFALGRYDEAAAPMYSVLATGPGWDWTTLSGLYPNVDVFTQQLRALEAYCNASPQAASARFLLAALYMTMGSNDAAVGILKQVVALQPRDTLSAQLLTALTASPPADQAQAQPTPGQASAEPSAVAAQPANEPGPSPDGGVAGETAPEGPALPTGPVPAKISGSWTANPVKDVSITLALNPDKSFTWKVTDRGQSRQFQGTATFDNDILALAPPDQPPMVGSVTWQDDAHFLFKAIGAPPNDPGLTFGR